MGSKLKRPPPPPGFRYVTDDNQPWVLTLEPIPGYGGVVSVVAGGAKPGTGTSSSTIAPAAAPAAGAKPVVVQAGVVAATVEAAPAASPRVWAHSNQSHADNWLATYGAEAAQRGADSGFVGKRGTDRDYREWVAYWYDIGVLPWAAAAAAAEPAAAAVSPLDVAPVAPAESVYTAPAGSVPQTQPIPGPVMNGTGAPWVPSDSAVADLWRSETSGAGESGGFNEAGLSPSDPAAAPAPFPWLGAGGVALAAWLLLRRKGRKARARGRKKGERPRRRRLAS